MKDFSRMWLGHLPYLEAEALQAERREDVLKGRASECIMGATHPPVYVRGVRKPSAEDMSELVANSGVPVVQSRRGGLLTFHGPGQLMVYCVVDIRRRGLSIPSLVCVLEKSVIAALQQMGLDARRVDGAPGVWVDEKKVASVGLHFKRWVSMYCLAINLRSDPERHSLIRPCGLDPSTSTSLRDLLLEPPILAHVWNVVGNEITERIGVKSVDSYCSSG